MPSFSQHNLRLVVSGCSLHVSLTKFEDKFASLRQVNSPNNWNKFQICTDMYLIRFLPNFAVFCEFMWISRDFPDLPEFPGFATARNIRSPVYNISFSWLLPLDGFQFIFLCRVYCVTVKAIETWKNFSRSFACSWKRLSFSPTRQTAPGSPWMTYGCFLVF